MPESPHRRYDIAALKAALPLVPLIEDAALVRQRSRDFFRLSPILDRELRGKSADIIARPENEAELIALAAACARLRIPITPRGAGTGTYGQGVPEQGDVLQQDSAAIGLPPVFGAAAASPGAHLLLAMLPAEAEGDFASLMQAHAGRVTLWAGSRARDADPDATPANECAWGHTTLHARKVDRGLTYLQTLNPPGRVLESIGWSWRYLGAQEMPIHACFVLYEGEVAANGAHLLRLPPEAEAARARLDQIIAAHEAAGIPVANPHVNTLEAGSRHKRVPGDQLGFKAEVDPHGLLNPGKMASYVPPRP